MSATLRENETRFLSQQEIVGRTSDLLSIKLSHAYNEASRKQTANKYLFILVILRTFGSKKKKFQYNGGNCIMTAFVRVICTKCCKLLD
jgi:hypothetical protein